MKAFLIFGLAVASAHARSDDGFSSVSRTEDSLGNYQFHYDITDWDTNRKRWESGDADNNRKGGYSITDVDGKVRHLEYVADKNGFRAVIRTNEPGTAPGYNGNALYVHDGVKKILTAAQPALRFTGHVIKQQSVIPSKPIIYQQPDERPVIKHLVKTIITPNVDLYQNVQPNVLLQQNLRVAYQQPVVKPIFHVYQNTQTLTPLQPRFHIHQHPIMEPVFQRKSIVYQQPFVRPVVQPVHYQPYQSIQPIIAVQPKFVASKPLVKPYVRTQDVPVVAQKKIIVTPPPAYSGPRRKVQKVIEDPAQSYITPELPQLIPKRIPGYNPGLDDFEDSEHDTTVAPPMSRNRVAYAPIGKFQGITRKSGSFPPLAGPPSRRVHA